MCQLTYCNLHDPYLNSLLVYELSTIGSARHNDGCGIICADNKIWKTKLAAKSILNLGSILFKKIQNDSPVPFHIRMATHGIEVKDENAHPFVGKHFTLMHNGTLLPRNGEEPKDKTIDSDSLRFLKALDECKDISPKANFEETFNGAMANFAGKFAFIIRDTDNKVDYVVRGRTADLWISFVMRGDEKQGYIINTSNLTMKDAFKEFVNLAALYDGSEYVFSEPKLLDAESIYIAEDMDIKKIGKAVEVTPVKKAEVVNHFLPRTSPVTSNISRPLAANIKEIADLADDVFKFLDKHSLGLLDLQLILQISSGISILEMKKEDAIAFRDYLINKISAPKAIRKQVSTILKNRRFPFAVYERYNLQYPWTVNPGNVVLQALKEYVKENK